MDSPSFVAPDARAGVLPTQLHYETELDANLRHDIDALVRTHAITRAALFQAAWALVLSRRINRNDLCFGNVASGREAPVSGIEDMFGLFITTTPLRVQLNPREPRIELVQRIQKECAAMLDCQHVPLTDIHRAVGMPALFDTLFTLENYPIQSNPSGEGALPLKRIRGRNGNHYPLSIAIVPDSEIMLRFHYSADAFSAEAIQDIAAQFVWAVRQIVQDCTAPVGRIDVTEAPTTGRHASGAVLPEVNRPAPTLLDLIEQAARHHSANTALAQGSDCLTYAELSEAALRVGSALESAGVGPEDIVAIALPRSTQFFVAALGVWKAGAAFLPLDPEGPHQRLTFMLANATPKRIIASNSIFRSASTSANRRCRRRSMRPAICCRKICPRLRFMPRSIRRMRRF
jgi:non-ribosomal peptide synthetase component F